MIQVNNSILLILISAALTFLLRAIPFLIFGGKDKMPQKVIKVANILPTAIMSVLVVYCLKNELWSLRVTLFDNNVIAAFISLVAVMVLHLWKRKTLISIATGTIIYMLLIRI